MGLIFTRRLVFYLVVLLIVLLIGTFGFYIIEHDWSLLDSFYFTLITITTIGYGEVHPLDPEGRIFTVILIILGLGTTLYGLTSISELIFEGKFIHKWLERRMIRDINKLKGHYIVCGYGRMGRLICQELKENNEKLVIVEHEPSVVEEVQAKEYLFVKGDATTDEILQQANIKEAAGLVSVLGTDATNVFIVLTARNLNKDIYIISRYDDPQTEAKLIKAGASRVLSPNSIGSTKVVQYLLRPTVTDFLDIALENNQYELIMDECQLDQEHWFVGKSIVETELRQKYDIIVIGIKKINEEFIFNPKPNTQLEVGDVLIIMGAPSAINRLKKVM